MDLNNNRNFDLIQPVPAIRRHATTAKITHIVANVIARHIQNHMEQQSTEQQQEFTQLANDNNLFQHKNEMLENFDWTVLADKVYTALSVYELENHMAWPYIPNLLKQRVTESGLVDYSLDLASAFYWDYICQCAALRLNSTLYRTLEY